MLNAAAIATNLLGLVGWHPAAPGNPAGALALPPALLLSRSGLYAQDLNELLSFDVLAHLPPRGEVFGDWLLRVHLDALQRFVTNLAAAQSLRGQVLLAATPLVKGPGRVADAVNKLGRFVGVEIALARSLRGVSFALPALSLQLDGVLSQELVLYLYSAEGPEPLAEFVVPAGENKAGYPFAVDVLNQSLAAATGYGGKAYLGYYEDDLPAGVHAINHQVGPCGCANDPFAKWSEYLAVRPFAAPASTAGGPAWNAEQISYEGGNYGLNPQFFGYCDVATALQSADNQTRLAPAVQLALAIRLLEALYSSSNLTAVTARQDVQADAYALLSKYQAQLYGGKDAATDAVYPGLLKGLALDLSGLDAVCQAPKVSRIFSGTLRR